MFEDISAPDWLRATHVWKVKTGLASHFQNAGFPVMQFRHVDLVQDPAQCIDQIARFCSLEGSETIFVHERVYVGEGPGGTDRTRPVERTSEHAWSDILDMTTARDVLAHAQPLACQLGYRDHQDG